MTNLTELQMWKTIRSLVSTNYKEIKRSYSSSVYSRVFNNPDNYGLNENQKRQKANNIINKGMSDINIGIGRKFHERDIEGYGIYKNLNCNSRNWIDYLSSNDLFQLFVLQNNLLKEVDKFYLVRSEDVVKATLSIPTHFQFSGVIEYTGKPPKVKEDKIKVDIKDPENINYTLITLAERAHNSYRAFTRRSCRDFTAEDLEYFNFGEHSGRVAKAFIQAKEVVKQTDFVDNNSFEEYESEQKFTEKMVGFDEQGTPVFERKDSFGNVDYFTMLNENFKGQVFGRDDEDREFFIGEVGIEDFDPTKQSDLKKEKSENSQTSLFKQDVER